MKDKRLLVIFLTVFIDLVGFGIIIPLNTYLARTVHASPLWIGLLMSIYSLMQFLFAPIWGQLSDRIGRRPVILISLLGGAIAHTAFGFATSMTGFLLARGFAGLFGGNISTAMAYIADITPNKDRSKGMGMIGAAFGLGFVLGPLLGGGFAKVGLMLGSTAPLGESFPAIIAGGICFVNFLFAVKNLPESRQKNSQPQAKTHRFKKIWRAFTTPVLGTLIFMVFLNTYAMALIEMALFLFVQDKFGWTLVEASFGFGYIGVIMVITQGYLIRKLMPKLGERNLMIAGLILTAVGFGVISLSSGLALMTVGVTALGFGNGLTNPSLNGSVSLVSGEDVQGNNLGVSQSLSSLARILGPPAGGYLYEHMGNSTPFAAAAGIALCGTLVAVGIRQRLPQTGKVAAAAGLA